MKQKLIAVVLLTLIPFTDSFAQFGWPWQQEKKEEKSRPGSNRFVYNNCAREVKLQFLKQVYPESNNQFREKFVKDLSEKPTDQTPGYVERRKCELKKKLDNLVKFKNCPTLLVTALLLSNHGTHLALFKSYE